VKRLSFRFALVHGFFSSLFLSVFPVLSATTRCKTPSRYIRLISQCASVPACQRARSAFASAVCVWIWCGLKPRLGGCPWPTPLAPASTLLLPHPGSCLDLGASCLLGPFWPFLASSRLSCAALPWSLPSPCQRLISGLQRQSSYCIKILFYLASISCYL